MSDEQGIASMGGIKGTCFNDSEGNIISVVQFERVVRRRMAYDELIET